MQGTVLIADGIATSRILLKAKLAPWSFDVIIAESGADLFQRAKQLPPSLIVISDDLPDMRAAVLCARLKTDPALQAVPVIAIARSHTASDRIALLHAGADEAFARPVRDTVLQARVRSLIRARTGVDELALRDETARALGFAEAASSFAPAAHVALLTPDVARAEKWHTKLLAKLPSTRMSAHGFSDIPGRALLAPGPDVFVIGLFGQNPERGLRLLADLRAHPTTRHASVLVILDSAQDENLIADALDLGAGDLMIHGFDADELAIRLGSQIRQKQTQDRLRASVEQDLQAAVRDPMTGLFNRRYALPYLARLIEQNLQDGRGFAVMLADLDHFKSVNDRYGHAAGDAVLTEAADRLRDDLRAEDLIARMGGEEFLIVLPDSSYAEASFAAERLRNKVDSRQFDLPDGHTSIPVTISIGVAVCCFERIAAMPPQQSARHLLQLADEALYDAKGAGRNQVTLVKAA